MRKSEGVNIIIDYFFDCKYYNFRIQLFLKLTSLFISDMYRLCLGILQMYLNFSLQ